MSDCVGDASAYHVPNEPVAVRRHGYEIAFLALSRVDDLVRRVSRRENRIRIESCTVERILDLFDVCAIDLHLFALAQRELADVARSPSVGDVNQHDRRAVLSGQLLNVVDYHLVVRRVLEGNQYSLVHAVSLPPRRHRRGQRIGREARC